MVRIEKMVVNKPHIYPVFIPHAGCPFQCVYCNQHVVAPSSHVSRDDAQEGSGLTGSVSAQLKQLAKAAREASVPGEVAFYGGTFTALPSLVLESILKMAAAHVRRGVFTGIRFSTRPDTLSDAVCSTLSSFPVTTVELGVQSLCDEVLRQSCRGYDSETVFRAIGAVRKNAWQLGIQLMAGLPGDTRERFLQSVEKAVTSRPAFVRIYPTIVLTGTVLAEWYHSGHYRPLDLHEAVDWCAEAAGLLDEAGIPIARMGLHFDPELEAPGRVLAGPRHPAFGYLVRSHRWRTRIDDEFLEAPELCKAGRVCVRVGWRLVSEVKGSGFENLLHWQKRWGVKNIEVLGVQSWAGNELEVTGEK